MRKRNSSSVSADSPEISKIQELAQAIKQNLTAWAKHREELKPYIENSSDEHEFIAGLTHTDVWIMGAKAEIFEPLIKMKEPESPVKIGKSLEKLNNFIKGFETLSQPSETSQLNDAERVTYADYQNEQTSILEACQTLRQALEELKNRLDRKSRSSSTSSASKSRIPFLSGLSKKHEDEFAKELDSFNKALGNHPGMK